MHYIHIEERVSQLKLFAVDMLRVIVYEIRANGLFYRTCVCLMWWRSSWKTSVRDWWRRSVDTDRDIQLIYPRDSVWVISLTQHVTIDSPVKQCLPDPAVCPLFLRINQRITKLLRNSGSLEKGDILNHVWSDSLCCEEILEHWPVSLHLKMLAPDFSCTF